MRAFVVKELGHHSKITPTTDYPEPVPTSTQVLVDVYSVGLNFFEILQVQGRYQSKPSLPFILGTEFAGKISKNCKIPDGCPYKPGDRVFGAATGAFAEKVAVDWQTLVPLPSNLTFNQGAGLYITWPTSYEALVGRAELKAGEWVLVTAAAGGVGLAAVQIAKMLKAKVIAAAGSDAKLEVAKRYGGADYCINYSKPGWQKEVLSITNGRGVDVIYDPVGLINDCLKCIAWKGRALVIGFAAGQIEKVPMNIILLKNISLVGIHWGAYATKEPSRVPEVWRDLVKMLLSGQVSPLVYDKLFTLDTLANGLTALEQRQTWGKAVAIIRDEESKERAKM